MAAVRSVALAACIASSACGFGAASAEKVDKKLDVISLVENQPLNVSILLGERLSNLFPDVAWDSAPIAGEYKDNEIRYITWGIGSFFRLASKWPFINYGHCVSGYSFPVFFFNHGYLFRIEYHFISSKPFPKPPPICVDHSPIFDDIAKTFNAGIEEREGQRRIIVSDDNMFVVLYTGEGSTGIDWFLKGAPKSGAEGYFLK